MRAVNSIYQGIVSTLAAVAALIAFIGGEPGRDVRVEPMVIRMGK